MKILVHFHLYYHEQLDYFLSKLSNITNCDWDLYVTYSEENIDSINKILKIKPNAKFIKVNNIGYDVLPFINLINSINLDEYDYILKIHTKRFMQKAEFPNGYKYKDKNNNKYFWRNMLIEPLIGSKRQFKKNLKFLSRQLDIGMIADESYFIRIDINTHSETKKSLEELYKKLGINDNYNYFLAGTMFIIKSDVLKIYQQLNIDEQNFDKISKSGTYKSFAHTLERTFAAITIANGYKIITRKNYKTIFKYNFKKFIKTIFSIGNSYNKSHKVITILGIKLKIKRKARDAE